ncbi:MAG: type II restriction endonuclease [bacterium]
MNFKAEFEAKLASMKPNYIIRGIVTADNRIYPLGSDTKVLSSVFELIARPLVYAIAEEHGLRVHEAKIQNAYPDFTLMKNERDTKKIAVDVKTTYRDAASGWRVNFTLGGYTSFIRNETKNIEFPFSQYAEHWVIGFIYGRVRHDQPPAHVYALKDVASIPAPYTEVDVFVQEKWRIAGDCAGSGNTTNIGSINGTLEDFREGRGCFESEAEFLEYWRGYGRTKADRSGVYSNISQFRGTKRRR